MYTVAEKFLLRHDLPTTYHDQIVKFLETNTQGATLDNASSSDPFTGGSSYRAGGPPAGPGASGGTDPFTGAGAYRPTSQPAAMMAGGDPFTSGSAYSGSTASAPTFQAIKAPQYFNAINVEPLKKKVKEFNDSAGSLALTPDEQTSFDRICGSLGNAQVSEQDAQSLLAVTTRWSLETRFPCAFT